MLPFANISVAISKAHAEQDIYPVRCEIRADCEPVPPATAAIPHHSSRWIYLPNSVGE
jgi:hypothetical protein